MKFNEDLCFRFAMYLQAATAKNQPSLLLSVEWISANLKPEEVFSDKQLDQWAKDSGYAYEATLLNELGFKDRSENENDPLS